MQAVRRELRLTKTYGHYAELAREAQRLADQVEELSHENDMLRDALAMSRDIMREWSRRP